MFYKTGVDITKAKSMFNFINEHFQYWTMNSWNKLKSIANNVKLYNLNLDGDWCTALEYINDEHDIGGLQSEISDLIWQWEHDHPGYGLGFNGRSAGYLVIYNHDKKNGTVNFKSILPECLQGFDSYEEWKESITEPWYGSRDTVGNYISILQEYTELIRSFDKLCDEIRNLVNVYSTFDYDADKKAYMEAE